MIREKSSKKSQAEKLKTAVNRWKEAMRQYQTHAEREFNRIKTLIESAKNEMTDAEVKAATKMLGKSILICKI